MEDDVCIQFDANDYVRPNQKWRCGLADEGLPCPLGPSRSGACSAICTPYKEGDRYYCDNASKMGGNCEFGPLEDGACCFSPSQCVPTKKGSRFLCGRGVCPDGPNPDGTCCEHFTPCRPVRSIMARRRLFSICAFAAALSAVCLMLGGSRLARNHMLSPGEVAANHMSIVNDCSQCHAVGEGSIDDLLHASLSGQSALAQNGLCVECHRDLGSATDAPHSCDAATLAAIGERIAPSSGGPMMIGASRLTFGSSCELACAACHHEHNGPDFDLKRMADHQCQSCHTLPFHSFLRGHPEFSVYPYRQRTRIYFDHESHYGVHFRDVARLPITGDAVKPFLIEDRITHQSCQACHTTDMAGQNMDVRPFEQSCAACHAHQIEDDTLHGLSVFALPVLDPDVFAVRKSRRQAQTIEAVGALPPILRLMLSADEEFAALDETAAGFDLSLLDADEKEAATAYVKALGRGLQEIYDGGQPEIERRLGRVLGLQTPTDEIRNLAGLVRHDWIALAQVHIQEMLNAPESARDSGPSSVAGADDLTAIGSAQLDRASHQLDRGWYVRTRDLSLRYRPIGHADPLLRAWLDMAARFGGDASAPAAIRAVYEELANPAATGRCMKCHTVETSTGGGLTINWHPFRPAPSERRFTRFAHQPHLIMLNGQACLACHKLMEPSNEVGKGGLFRPEFISAEFRPVPTAEVFDPNFQPVLKADCTSCHQPGRVSESCTTCHNYHVTSGL